MHRLFVTAALKIEVGPRRDVGYDWVPDKRTRGRNGRGALGVSGELRARAVVDN